MFVPFGSDSDVVSDLIPWKIVVDKGESIVEGCTPLVFCAGVSVAVVVSAVLVSAV